MTRGTKWHKKIVDAKREELRQKGFSVPGGEKRIGFEWPADLESQLKQPDILAENENEVVIVEVEDAPKANGMEKGVAFVELGGILLLSYISAKYIAKKTNKKVVLHLIFPKNVEKHRFAKIIRIIDEARNVLTSLQINVELRQLSE